MAVSDKLFALANRAKEAENKIADARKKKSAELQAEVTKARAAATKRTEALRAKLDDGRNKMSESWQHSKEMLEANIAISKAKIEQAKLEHDAKHADKKADRAEYDAAFSVDYAYAALEDAELDVLSAILARKHANDLASVVHA